MRRTILAAAATLSIAAAGGGLAFAQSAPPPVAPPPPAPGIGMPMHGPGGPDHHHRHHGKWHEGMQDHRGFTPGAFALFPQQADRHLAPQDVQQIAEALLLWHGNHTWKVSDVTPGPDNTVRFNYAAPDNTVIAGFAMDTRTGRLTRVS